MTILSKFNTRCRRCGGPIHEGQPIIWVRGVRGSTHETQEACDAARAEAAATPAARIENHKPIADMLAGAQARGLTFPKVRFLAPDGRSELRLSLAGTTSKYPGAVQVKLNDNWIGRIEADGNVAGRELLAARDILSTLTRIGQDPAAAAAEYGRFTSRCSVCHALLTDDRSGSSVEMGYGPTCAARFGWPHHPRGRARELAAVPELTNELPPPAPPRAPRGRRRATQAPLFITDGTGIDAWDE